MTAEPIAAKPMRLLLMLLLAAGAGAGAACGVWLVLARAGGSRQIQSRHTGPVLEKLRDMSELVTLSVEVLDVQETHLDGKVGGITALLAVRGDVQVGVDLSAATLQDVNEDARTAVLVLPEPAVSRPRLDHDRSRLFAVRSDGLWLITPGDRTFTRVTDRAWAEAQRTVRTRTPRDFGYCRSRWCCATLAVVLYQEHGVSVSPETVRRWLHKEQMVWRRPRPVLDPKDPRRKRKLQKRRRLLRDLPDDEATVFQDDVDLNLNPDIGCMWTPKGE